MHATTATWNLNANGNWNVNANWTPATFPNAIDDTANFGNVITANRIVSLGVAAQNITVGTLTFDDNNNYTIQSGLAGNTLIFDVTAGNASLTLTNVNGSGSHLITCPITLNDTLLMSHSSTASFTISGIMGGTGGLTKTGTGTGALVLSGANNYGGATSIQSGGLTYNVNGAIPAGSVVTVGDGVAPNATLTIAAAMTVGNALDVTINSDGTLTQNSSSTTFLSSLQGSGTINLSTAGTAANLFNISLSADKTYSGAIAGGLASSSTDPAAANRLTKDGTATLTLSSASTYASRTFIANGVIDVQNGSALGIPGANSTVYIRSSGGNVGSLYLENNITLAKTIRLNGSGFGGTGALRNLSGSNTVLGNITIGWAGGVEVASDATIQVDMGTTLTCNGIISGASNLRKTNPGTLIFMGGSNNTLTGLTTINEGILQLNKTAGINALAGNATINAAGTLQLLATNQIVNTSIITLAGGTFNMGGFAEIIGSLVYNSGTLSQGGALLTLANATPTALSMSDALTITGNLAFSAAGGVTYTGTTTRAIVSGDVNIGTTAHAFNIADGTDTVDMVFSGAITGTTGTITKSTGTGVLLFSGSSANTYTGLTTVSAGELQLNKSGVNALNGSATVNTGGTLSLLAANQIVDTATLTVAGGTFNMGGFSETVTRLVFSSGTISQGGATLSLSATTGTALTMGDGTTLSDPIALTGGSGTPGVTYNGATTTATISGSLDLGTVIRTFNIAMGTGTTDMEISGVISGTGGITKLGGLGRLDFTGSSSNTYTGTTTVSFGTLFLNKSMGQAIVGDIVFNDTSGFLVLGGNNQIGSASDMTLVSGTFDMNGFNATMGTLTYTSGTFTQSGGTLTLASAGTALLMRNTTISGALVLSGGGAIQFDNASNGTGTLSGTIDLGGNATTFNVEMGTAITDLLVSGVISNGAMTKIGTGQMEFSGASANTYTGLSTITAGTLLLNKTPGVNAIAGDVLINGGTLTLGGAGEIADTSTMTMSSGTFNMAGFAETLTTLNFNGGTLTQAGGILTLTSASTALSMRNTTISGEVDLTGGGAVVFDSTSNGTATISGMLDLGGFTTPFTINNGTSANDMTVSGVISNGAVTKGGAGRLQYSGASPNTYTGLTTVSNGMLLLNKTAGVTSIVGDVLVNGGILDCNTANQIATTSSLTLSSGTWDTSGQTQTINSFTFQGGTLTQSGGTINLGSASTALTMRDTTIAGPIVLSGGGSVVFDNTNNGTATISSTLNLGGNITSFDIAEGTAATDMVISGVISNGGVTKISAGQLQFSGTGANTYTGLSTVSAGTLLLSKTAGINAIAGDALINGGTLTLGNANQIANTSTLTLDSGAFNLGGFAESLATFNFNAGTYTSGGGTLTLASIATALSMRDTTLTGAVVISTGGTIAFDNTNNGTATLNGTLDLGNAVIPFNISEGTAATDMLINSIISNGSLTKTGAGTLVLAGANTYAGGTVISAGTLQGDATSLQGMIIDNANLVFDQIGTGTYADMITGTGTFVKQGAGTLILSNTNSVGGTATVSNGTLIVNGALGGGGAMGVAPGAFLKGTGTITKDVTVSGTLIAGNSIGTIHLVGAQTFAAGSNLEIELDPTTSDLVDIVGTLLIQPGSTLSLVPDPGTYAPLTSYTIIQTTGGVSGTFSTIGNTFPLFRPTVIYTPLDVLLEMAALPFSDLIHGGNAGQVAQCLDSLAASDCSDMNRMIRALQVLPTVEAIKDALLQLQPSAFTSLAVVQENDILYISNALEERLCDELHSCCPTFFKENGTSAVWLTALGAHTSQKNQKEEPGYIANSPGVIVGMDFQFAPRVQLGIGFGYTHSHVHWRMNRGEADLETLYWTLYGKWETQRAYVHTALLGGYNFYDIDRKIAFGTSVPVEKTAESHHQGLDGSAHFKSGVTFGCKHLVVSPFISLDYIYLHENAFKEQGAESLNLRVKAKNSDLLVSEIGVDLSQCFHAKTSTYTPYVQLFALRESRFEGQKERASLECGCQMTVKGLYPSRTLGGIAAGFNAEIARHLLSLSYLGKYGYRYSDNSFYFQYRCSF
jgi:autotransporter-associated beta strand protein